MSVSAALVALLGLLLLATAARAEDDFDSDRPDQAEGPQPLPVGRVQLEAGISRSQSDDAHIDTAGEGLVRFGARRGFELRVLVPSWMRLDPAPSAGRRAGFGDAGLGVKLALPSPREALALGLVCDATFPSGQAPFRAGEPGLDLTLAATASRAEDALTANAGWSREDGGDAAVAVLSYERELAPRTAGYAEWAGRFDAAGADEVIDGGVTWRLAPLVQLDAHLGFGAGAGRGTTAFGAGVSERW